MNKIISSMLVLMLCFGTAQVVLAKGGGGGRGGGGFRGGSSRTTSVKTTSVKPSAPAKPTAPKISTKPSATTAKVTSTKTVTSSTGKKMSTQGSVVGGTYQPRFSGGYVAPAGSVVYYRQSSLLDYLPLYLILTSSSHREAVVQTPDGKTQTVKEQGIDTMYVINWIITILVGLGLIGLIVYLINRRTAKVEENTYHV